MRRVLKGINLIFQLIKTNKNTNSRDMYRNDVDFCIIETANDPFVYTRRTRKSRDEYFLSGDLFSNGGMKRNWESGFY